MDFKIRRKILHTAQTNGSKIRARIRRAHRRAFRIFFDGESNEENESASEVRSTFLDFVVFLLSEESAFFLEEESADDREEDEVF